jgi:hypothetical protein
MRSGLKTNVIAAAIKERIVGYQITFSIQRSQVERNASLCPNASLIHTYTPPDLGKLVDSSEEMRTTGRKNTNVAKIKKKTAEGPLSAMGAHVLIPPRAAIFIMIRLKTLSLRIFFNVHLACTILVPVYLFGFFKSIYLFILNFFLLFNLNNSLD